MALELGEHFGMRQPAAWADLNHAAEAQLNLPAGADGLRPTWRREITMFAAQLEELSDNELEAHRYYALGLAACELAKILRNPEARVEVIKHRANEIVDYHPTYLQKAGRPQGNMLYTCELWPWTGVESPLKHRLVDAFPESGLLVSDSLRAVSKMRFKAKENQKPLTDVTPFTPFQGDSVRNVANQLLSAASDITMRAIRCRQNGPRFMSDYTLEEFDPIIRDVIDPTDLRQLELVSPASSIAGLRLDEFERSQDFYDISPEGKMVFRPDLVSSDAGPLPHPLMNRQQFIHTNRLRCPALYVNQLIETALELVADSTALAAVRLEA